MCQVVLMLQQSNGGNGNSPTHREFFKNQDFPTESRRR